MYQGTNHCLFDVIETFQETIVPVTFQEGIEWMKQLYKYTEDILT